MKSITKILLMAFLLRVVFSFVTWHPDLNNHVDWGIRFWQYGPAKFYSPQANVWSFTWPNQPPGTIYMFAGVRKVFEAVFAFFWFINVKVPLFPSGIMLFFERTLYQALLKLPAILADVGMAYLIYRIFAKVGKERIGILGSILFLANPVVWYNSTIWGQTDATINFFGLLAFVLLLERRLTLAVASLLLSFYIKVSLLVFLPIFAIVVWRQRYSVKNILTSIVVPVFLVGLVTIPFSRGEPYGWLYEIYKSKVFTQQLQVITANAFNIWAALTGIHERPHTLMLGPLSYQMWGLILFLGAMVSIFKMVYRKQDATLVFWALSITAFASFMFLTNMHERYIYPLFPMLTILVAQSKKLLPLYLGISAISLLNLYNFWWYPRIEVLIYAMSAFDRLAPRVLGLVSFVLFVFLYLRFVKNSQAEGKHI
ncbi:MAG: hypothetical protein HYU80_01955 [Candidatus Blackburnbacteria bacterium]|nr:hypothetical protein [Candidatus Blackburnbacteria bacterium]